MEGLIQIAGVVDDEEARMLVDSGVIEIGFPLRLTVNKEDISEEQATRIISSFKPPVSGFLITYLSNTLEIVDLCRKLGVLKVQIHGDIPTSEIAGLRALAPGLRIVKSLVVRGANLPKLEILVEELSPHVHGFITDTYDPSTGACGATGKTHDWEISRRLVDMSPRPILLAGGLNPENVRRAILYVQPAGVDVHTGVEGPDGRKDRELVKAFVSRAREAFGAVCRKTAIDACGQRQ